MTAERTCTALIGTLAAQLCQFPRDLRATMDAGYLMIYTSKKPDMRRLVGSGGQTIRALETIARFLGADEFRLIDPVAEHMITGRPYEYFQDLASLAEFVENEAGIFESVQIFPENDRDPETIIFTLDKATPIDPRVAISISAAFQLLFRHIHKIQNLEGAPTELAQVWR